MRPEWEILKKRRFSVFFDKTKDFLFFAFVPKKAHELDLARKVEFVSLFGNEALS